MARKLDAIIVGAGQAGPPLANRLNRAGMKVALIERKLMGGTCVNTGCIPTKTLVGSARIAYWARQASSFGVEVGDVTVDMKQVKARKDAVVGASNRGVTEWVESMENVTLIRGHAAFSSPRSLVANDKEFTAEKIFLNVGARARVPTLPGLEDIHFLTNSSILELDALPEHLLIVGGSYIGLEFAQMYRRFGARVTVVERGDRLLKREDPDVSDAVRDILESEGVVVRLRAECMGFERRPRDGVRMIIECDEDDAPIDGSHVLLATGRRPNTDDLGLSVAGVRTDDRGHIEVDDQCRTNVEGIWAIGEVNGRGGFTHTSYNDYEVVAANLLERDPRRVRDRVLCYGLFIDPPLGRIGMTETQAKNSGRRVLVGRLPMSRVGRAKEFGDTRGFMKILVDGDTEELLGASILGMNGDEVVHSLLDVMVAGAPYTTVSRAVHIHPTVSELVPTALGDLQPL